MLEVGHIYTDSNGDSVVIVAKENLHVTKALSWGNPEFKDLVAVCIGRNMRTGHSEIFHENGANYSIDLATYIPEVFEQKKTV